MTREKEFDVADVFINRWSPRAMSGESISDNELMTLFEAAKWAPSSSNEQPWRFIYAKKDTEHWQKLWDLLIEFNQLWCKNAAALIVIVSKETSNKSGEKNSTHSFDTGAAWENLALQGSISGLVVHGMAGFDYEKAKQSLNIPDGYQVEAMCAVGKPSSPDVLPERMQKSETPNNRRTVAESISEGVFKE